MNRLLDWFKIVIKKQKELKRWQRIVTALAAIITFVTTYALILPAITVEKDSTEIVGGMYLEKTADRDDLLEENALEPVGVSIAADMENAVTFAYSDDDISATAVFSTDEEIPEGAELVVNPVDPESEDYADLSARAADLLDKEFIYDVTTCSFYDFALVCDNVDVTPETGLADIQIIFRNNTVEHVNDVVYAGRFAKQAEATDGFVAMAAADENAVDAADELVSVSIDESSVIELADGIIMTLSLKGNDLARSDSIVGILAGNVDEEIKAAAAEVDAEIPDYDESQEEDSLNNAGDDALSSPLDVESSSRTEDDPDATTEDMGEEITTALQVKTLKASGSDYTVILSYDESSRIPEEAVLTVSEIDQESEDYQNYLTETKKAMGLAEEEDLPYYAARFFDIKILVNGEEFTPEAGVNVEITYTEPLAEHPDTEVSAVHFSDETTAAEVIEANTADVLDDGKATVEFTADSFSVYGVIYTVDFHWEVDGKTYEFSIPGGGFASLEHLVEALGIGVSSRNVESVTEDAAAIRNEAIELNEVKVSEATKRFVTGVESVEFSSPSLVWVGKVDEATTVGSLKEANGLEIEYSAELTEEQIAEINAQTVEAGDWALISVQAFASEETLTVTMRSGDQFVVKITDAQLVEDSDKGTMDATKSYLICYQDGNDYYMLKNDGSVHKITTTDPETAFEGLNSSYAWTFNYIFTEKDIEHSLNINYYLIRPVDNRSKTIALNDANASGTALVQQGNNNTSVVAADGGFILQGYHNVGTIDDPQYIQLDFQNDAFCATTSEGVKVLIYEMDSQPTYTYTVRSSDETRGTVSVENGVTQTEPGQGGTPATHYVQAETDSDKYNAGTITATPVTHMDNGGHNKWVFDHWEQDGIRLNSTQYPAEIDTGTLPIPFNESKLVAYFVQNTDYVVPDIEKQSSSFEDLSDWLTEMKDTSEIPLDEVNCKKTAEVYDYENRIYKVDLTAQSNLKIFEGLVNLGFIIDVSGSMKFPSSLKKIPNKSIRLYQLNDSWNNKHNWLNTNETYYFITDEKATATVYRLWFADSSTRLLRTTGPGQDGYSTNTVNVGGVNYYYKYVSDVWLAVDASHPETETDFGKYIREIGHNGNTLTYRFTSSKPAYNQQADTQNTTYQIYEDDDPPYMRLDYLESSIDNSTTELTNIMDALAIAADPAKDQDVKIAWNTFCATVQDRHHEFISVKTNRITPDYTTSGGTRTDLALDDAYSFEWTTGDVGYNYGNYAILITDGAPQYANDGVHTSGDPVPYSDVESKANRLKAGKDGVLNTEDDVKLITVGLSMQNVDIGRILLYDLADTIDGQRMFFNAESGDELDDIIYSILKLLVKSSTVQGSVTDTIGQAFYPVDKGTGMPLEDGDMIDLEGNKITGEPSGKYGVIVKDGDSYSVEWEGQDFTWDGWHGVTYIKAKEDLIGGNAIDTNENAVIEATDFMFYGSDTPIPLKDEFKETVNPPSPKVNVNELDFYNQLLETTVPLGESVDPKTQLQQFYENIKANEVINDDGSLHYDLSADNIFDDRESAAGHGTNETFLLAPVILDCIKNEGVIENGVIVSGAKYLQGDGTLNWDRFLTDVLAGGITVPYHPYGIQGNDSNLVIRLTKVIKEGEQVPEDISEHATTLAGREVERYILTIKYNPDYVNVLPVGQGGSGNVDMHTGTYNSMYQGHAAGRETSQNTYIVNVFEGDGGSVDFDKVDTDELPLEGAVFTLYYDEEYSNPVTIDNNSVTGVSDADGVVLMTAGERTISVDGVSKTISGIPYGSYYMKETRAPEGYKINDQVYFVHIGTAELGGTSFIAPLEENPELEDDQTLLEYYESRPHTNEIENEPLEPIDIIVIKDWSDGAAAHASDTITFTLFQKATSDDNEVLRDAPYTGSYNNTITGGGQVIIPDLPADGRIDGIHVLYSYYVEETSGKAGYLPQITNTGAEEGEIWSILNIAPDDTDLATSVQFEKKWYRNGTDVTASEHNEDEITLKLIQTAYNSGYEPPVQVTLRLEDASGLVETETYEVGKGQVTFTATRPNVSNPQEHSVTVSVNNQTVGTGNQNNNVFAISITENTVITAHLNYRYIPTCGSNRYDRWSGNTGGDEGVLWTHSFSGSTTTPADLVDAILSDDDAEAVYTQEYTYVLGKDSLAGGIFTNTSPNPADWQGEVTGLPLFKKIDESTYYVYSYSIEEIAINGIPVTNGESSGYTVEVGPGLYDSENNETTVTITNTEIPGINITVKKVATEDVDDPSAGTLSGAAFSLEKYTDARYLNKDPEWVEQTIEDSENEVPGVFSFTDLHEGYYRLVETASPAGYVKISESPRFCVKENGVYIITHDGQEVRQTDMLKVFDDTNTVNVGNEPGAELPHTGGVGTMMLYMLGSLLTVGFIMMLIFRRLLSGDIL